LDTAYIDDAVETPSAGQDAPETLHQKIERRAFELFEARGSADGLALNDWLRAEEEMSPDRVS
jgi:hypothetical protein